MKKIYLILILVIFAFSSIQAQNSDIRFPGKNKVFSRAETNSPKRISDEMPRSLSMKPNLHKGNHPLNVIDTLVPPSFGMSCYTSDPNPLTIYKSSNGGYVAGNNGYGDLEKAQLYSIATNGTLSGVLVYIAKVINTSNSGIMVNIYDLDVNTGNPGNLLGSSDILYTGSVDTTQLSFFNFSTPVSVVQNFFVSVVLPSGADGDTIGIVSTVDPCFSGVDRSFEMWNDNSWASIKSGWNIDIDLVILPIVDIFVPLEDASVIDIPSPVSGCNLTNKETVRVTVKNKGTGVLSGFPVAYRADANAPVSENFSGTLNPGDTATYTFSSKLDLSGGGSHVIYVYTDLPTDGARSNDTMYTYGNNSISADLSSPVSMGFELTDDLVGWTRMDADGDGVFWDFIDTYVHSGTYCMRKAGSSHNDNDWLFTKCLDLTTGINYKLEYFYKNFDLIAPCSIESRVGMINDSTMSQIIVSDPLPGDTSYQYSSTTFTIPLTGRYYVGFRAYSTAGTGSSSMRLDDIKLSIDLTIGQGEKMLSSGIKLYPNPSTGIIKLSNEMMEGQYSLKIINTLGQEITNRTFAGNMDQTLDLSACPNGVYFIELKSSKEVLNQKIYINH
jgi:hypothetical protein